MISFESDYIQGADPRILEALVKTNLEALPGYGADKYCDSAKEKIIAACENKDAEVHFLVGGTQTNQIIIASMLRLYEGAVADGCRKIEPDAVGRVPDFENPSEVLF